MAARRNSRGEREYRERKHRRSEECRILLIGKTGNGKSATGNTILGDRIFKESAGIVSATEEAQSARNSQNITVVDTPDVWSMMEEGEARREVKRWRDTTSPYPHAVLLVVRADTRFTQEEYTIFLKTKELLRAAGVVKGRDLDNLIVVFTMWDKMKMDEETFARELNRANSELRDVLNEARSYVMLDNTQPGSSWTQDQVEKLMNLIRFPPSARRVSARLPASPNTLRVILVGAAGCGKSSTGNSLLGARKFDALGFPTAKCSSDTVSIAGYQLEVIDTPGIKVMKNTDITEQEIAETRKWFSPYSLDAILFVVKISDNRIEKSENRVCELLKSVTDGIADKYTIVVFIRGDQSTTPIDEVLQKADSSIRKIFQDSKSRYVMFDKKDDDPERRREQRDALVDAIVTLRNSNHGKCLQVSCKLQTSQPTAAERPKGSGWRWTKCVIS